MAAGLVHPVCENVLHAVNVFVFLQFCVQACLPTALLVEACLTTAVRMSVTVNYLKSRMEILILNAKTGMDTNRQHYEGLSKDAVNAIKQV